MTCLFCDITYIDQSMFILNPPERCCRSMCFLYFKCYLFKEFIFCISDLRKDELCETSEGSLFAIKEIILFSPISQLLNDRVVYKLIPRYKSLCAATGTEVFFFQYKKINTCYIWPWMVNIGYDGLANISNIEWFNVFIFMFMNFVLFYDRILCFFFFKESEAYFFCFLYAKIYFFVSISVYFKLRLLL